MIKKHLIIIAPIALALAGCAGSPDDTSTTLESLESRTITFDTSPPKRLDVNRAIETYEGLASNIEAGALNAKAMRSLADLEMQRVERDSEEKGLFSNYDKAIRWYEKLLTSYPRYEEREEVIYQLARAYEASGLIDETLRALKILIRDYPASDRVDEASFRRGELSFSDQNYREAETDYGRVVKLGNNSKFYEQAIFKYGWAIYKQNRCTDALAVFLTMLDGKLNQNLSPYKLQKMAFLSKSEIDLIDEVLRATNLCFSQSDNPLYINEYFKNKAPRIYEFILYSALGEYFLSQERVDDAIKVYSGFYLRAKWHPYGVLLQNEAIELIAKQGRKDALVPAKKEFVYRYEYLTKYWKSATDNNYFEYLVRTDDVSLTQIKTLLKTHLLELAHFHHAHAQKTKRKADYQEATKWYRRYLKNYPKGDEAPGINFLLAEALFEEGLYEESVREFTKTAYEYEPHNKSTEAAYASLLAYTRQEALLQSKAKADWHQVATHASLKFAHTFPKDPRAVTVLVKLAQDFYKKQSYTEALSAAQRAVDHYPNANKETRRIALTILANTHFELKHFNIAEQFYAEITQLVPKNSRYHREAKKRLVASIYQQAEQLKREGALPEAIDELKRLLVAVPDTDQRPIIEYDIAALYTTLDNWEMVLELLKDYAKKYPNHSLTPTAEEKVALAYLRLERNSDAATALIGLSSSQQNPEMARDSLWQAAELFENAKELENAANTYLQYVQKFPRPLEAAVEANYRIAKIYKKQNLNFNYRIQLQKIYEQHNSANTGRSARTRYLAAQSAFELAEPLYERYEKVQLVEPIKINMKLKNQYMKKALKAYNKAANLDIAEFTTAATYRIGAMYSDFSQKLIDSDRPTNLNEEEMEQYELMLEEQAFPFEEQAIELHQANASRIVTGLYDKWVRLSLDSLADYMPTRYKKPERRDAVFTSLQ